MNFKPGMNFKRLAIGVFTFAMLFFTHPCHGFEEPDPDAESRTLSGQIKRYEKKAGEAKDKLTKIIEDGRKNGDSEFASTIRNIINALNEIDHPQLQAPQNKVWFEKEIETWEMFQKYGTPIATCNSVLEQEIGSLEKEFRQSKRDSGDLRTELEKRLEKLHEQIDEKVGEMNEFEEKILGEDLPTELDEYTSEFSGLLGELVQLGKRTRQTEKFCRELYRYIRSEKDEMHRTCLMVLRGQRRNIEKLARYQLDQQGDGFFKELENRIENAAADRIEKYRDLLEDWDDVNKPLRLTLREYNDEFVFPVATSIVEGITGEAFGYGNLVLRGDEALDKSLDKLGAYWKQAWNWYLGKKYEKLELYIEDMNDRMTVLENQRNEDIRDLESETEQLIARYKREHENDLRQLTAKKEKSIRDMNRIIESSEKKENDPRVESYRNDIKHWDSELEAEISAYAKEIERVELSRKILRKQIIESAEKEIKELADKLKEVNG